MMNNPFGSIFGGFFGGGSGPGGMMGSGSSRHPWDDNTPVEEDKGEGGGQKQWSEVEGGILLKICHIIIPHGQGYGWQSRGGHRDQDDRCRRGG